MSEENIVKKTCKELGITQKELATKFDVSQASISEWNKGNIPKMTEMALVLMLENIELKTKLKKIKEAQQIIDSITI